MIHQWESKTPDARPIDSMLDQAIHCGASDIHIEPTAQGYEIRYRIDGLMETAAAHSANVGRAIAAPVNGDGAVAHLSVGYSAGRPVHISTQGLIERAGSSACDYANDSRPASRRAFCPAELIQPKALDQLQLPDGVIAQLKSFAAEDSGMLVVTGPAGSGKTTTVYALHAIHRTNHAGP